MPNYAHTAEDSDGNRLPQSKWQLLHSHSCNVAKYTKRFAQEFNLGKEVEDDAFLAGFLHDLGKYRKVVQKYLRGEPTHGADTQHAIFGAAFAAKHDQCPAASAIAGHHAGLHDLDDLPSAIERSKAKEPEPVDSLFQMLKGENCTVPSPVSIPSFPGIPTHITRAGAISETAACLATEFYTRMLFSCLVDADRLDSAFWQTPSQKPPVPAFAPAALLEKILAERDRKRAANPASALSTVRNDIFDACLRAGTQTPGFFSLTVPTGGGKTLAAMAFALAHAHTHTGKHDFRRVIIVIPYLSIIEQNAAEYRRILDPENTGIVLEHHSSAQPSRNASEEELSQLELATENWDAPVVITTSVQFLESLLASSPSRARKLHNIARSIVIFDEVQTLPAHLLAPMLSVFRELAANYGTSFVFSSATQPAFRRTASLPDGFTENELREIAPAPDALFRQLRRVSYHFHPTPFTWPDLADKLVSTPQVLCVVNLTRHARELWEELSRCLPKDERPIHLSSAMCPAHRLALIRRIRQRLKSGLPCRVISTQLIEAGVDVDFPEVWRAMGPLDSIVQVAGRCNREGRRPAAESVVHVFIPADNKLPLGIYTTATDQAVTALAALGEKASEDLATDPAIFRKYFTALHGIVPVDHTKRGEATIQQERENLHFRKVAEKAVVIKNSGTPVIVPIGKGRHIIAAIRARANNPARAANEPRFTRDDLRRLQRYMVNAHDHDFHLLQQRGFVEKLLPNLEVFILKESHYNRDLGFLPNGNQSPQDSL
jgi:CRISPR-associated endonuclease/helicase Cas3